MKRILLTILMLAFLPAVLGVEFSLTCPEQPGEAAFSCTINYNGLDPDNFGGFDFTVQVNGLTLNRPTTDHGSLQYNQNTGSGAVVYDYAGIDASGRMISLPLQKAAGAGDTGTVTITGMVFYDIDSNPTDIPDATVDILFVAPAPVEEAGPPPPPPPAPVVGEEEEVASPPPPPAPGAPGEEEEVPAEEEEREDIPRAPLTEEQLAPEADADGDGEANVDDEDDDGDNVPDEEDLCSSTYTGAERVTDSGCLEGDLGGAEDDTPPDGCVNNQDISAADFLQRLLDDGFEGLSSLLWGMFDNWNAGEGTC